MLAATAPMPPSMMAHLTPSQQAYARFVVDETLRVGDCRLSLDEIAARCGMCSKTAQRAQDRLKEFGWIKLEHRPMKGAKNLPNIITVVSTEWLTWIKLGKIPRRIGRQERPATGNTSIINTFIADLEVLRNAPRPPQELEPKLAASLMRLGTLVRAADQAKITPHQSD